MRILVTGGAGFIGSNLISYWMERYPEDEIVNFDLLTYAGNLENLAGIEKRSNYRFVKGDIREIAEVEAAAAGVELMIHCAAETHVDRSILDPGQFIKTNVWGTEVLLEVARKKKIRFHHMSTDEVYGSLPIDGNDKFSLKTAYDPSSPYSASKAAADHLVKAYHRTFGLPVTISNCSNNFGPFQFPEKFIPLAITNLMEDKPVPVYGDGRQIRDWLYVADHCRALDLIIHQGKIGKTYLIGGLTENITNLEILKKILRIMHRGEEMVEYVSDRPGHDVKYAIDWSDTNRELGYQPARSLDEALADTVNWYQQNRGWWQRVKSGEYQHYYQQQYGNR